MKSIKNMFCLMVGIFLIASNCMLYTFMGQPCVCWPGMTLVNMNTHFIAFISNETLIVINGLQWLSMIIIAILILEDVKEWIENLVKSHNLPPITK